MRAKLVMGSITALAVMALALQAPPQAIAQGSASKAAPQKKTKAEKPAPQAPTMMSAQKPAAKKPAKKKSTAMKGVPKGVANCLKHLTEMAAKDPLIAYEGHPEEVINNGLLWNDPKSKCSVGSDENMRKKVAELAKAWRLKDAATVRSLIQELEGMSH